LYGSPASGASWVVPAKYYQEVGPDGFKKAPIGAGPYKLVRHGGDELELEAVPDYWRKTPAVKTLIIRGLAEEATRVAALQAGEVDFVNQVTGPLVDMVKSDPNLRLHPVLNSPFWLEFVRFENPDSPFNKKQVREAVSLAIDRKAINEAESNGLGVELGNWIPENWPGAITWPIFPHDPDKAKQLMAEAGYPDGFDVENLTPLPPYNSLAERVISQLRTIGIRTKLQTMERGAFTQKLAEGPDAFGRNMLLHISGNPGDAAARIRSFAICPPKGANSRTCDPQIDSTFERYEMSVDPREREQLLNEVQTYMLENLIYVPIYRQAFNIGVGPRIANDPKDVAGSVPQYSHVGPYEDIRLNE
ncbi:MAG TPA: ABC transporter substrate-binding protein, partial [Dehalococcoidia bacterium]|nr:ABC transporter substrate-binding protein [Dehalococcoidia bacterium]